MRISLQVFLVTKCSEYTDLQWYHIAYTWENYAPLLDPAYTLVAFASWEDAFQVEIVELSPLFWALIAPDIQYLMII